MEVGQNLHMADFQANLGQVCTSLVFANSNLNFLNNLQKNSGRKLLNIIITVDKLSLGPRDPVILI